MDSAYNEALEALQRWLAGIASRETDGADLEHAEQLAALTQRGYGLCYAAESKQNVAMLAAMKWGSGNEYL